MIELLVRLCQLLASDHVTVADVVSALGGAILRRDLTSATVRPANPSLAEVRVVTEPERDEPAYVELVPAPTGRLTVAELKPAFGEYHPLPRVHWNTPRQIIFYPETAGTSHRCALIAAVQPGARGLEDGEVTSLTLRRDARVD